jgi:hypothetical protein
MGGKIPKTHWVDQHARQNELFEFVNGLTRADQRPEPGSEEFNHERSKRNQT